MRILVLLVVSVLLVTGCGKGERDGRAASRSTLRIEPLEVRGGTFIEGSVYALQIDGVKRWTKPQQYSETVALKLRTGSYDVTLRNYACNTACSSWADLEKLMTRQRANNGGRPGGIERTVTRCEATVVLKRGQRASMVPYITVAAKGSSLLGPTGANSCRWEGRGVNLKQPSTEGNRSSPKLPSLTSAEQDRLCAAPDKERTMAEIYREHGLTYDSRVDHVSIACLRIAPTQPEPWGWAVAVGS